MTLFRKTEEQTIGSKNMIAWPLKSFTQGVFDEDFYRLDKISTRNNLSEQDSIDLIDKIRANLSMNQK